MQNFNTLENKIRGAEMYPSREMLSKSNSKLNQLSAKKGHHLAFSSEFGPKPTDFETMLNRSNSKKSESTEHMELISQK